MIWLREWRDIFANQIGQSLAIEVQYRASALIWIMGAVLEPVIYLVVWSTVARELGGSVNGMTPGDFAAYYITAMFVSRMTFNWLNWTYEEYVRDGTLAARLMRPVPPVISDFNMIVANKIFQVTIVLPIALVLVFLFETTFNFQLWSLLAAVPVLLTAFLLRFTVEWVVALSAFWATRMRAINNLYFTTLLLMSGMVAPLSLFPPNIERLTWFLPWRWMIYFPVQLILGSLTPNEAWIGWGMQLIWLAIAAITAHFVWAAGTRRFASVGG